MLLFCFPVFLRAKCSIEDPVMAPGALIDVAGYMGSLSFHVWEKMHEIVTYSWVPALVHSSGSWGYFLEIFSCRFTHFRGEWRL